MLLKPFLDIKIFFYERQATSFTSSRCSSQEGDELKMMDLMFIAFSVCKLTAQCYVLVFEAFSGFN